MLLVVMALSLTACGKKESANSDFKVGAIYINSQNDTAGYTYAHHHGITEAMKQLGLSESQLFIIDNVPEDDTEVGNAIDTLAGKGCNIIFGISFGYINAFNEAASKPEYKDIIFSHATGYLSNDTNFNNYFGRIYQARYLSGIAAGLKAKELGNPNLGYVAAWGLEYAETCSGINAFALGAQSVYPEAIVHVKEIYTWGDEALERQAAQSLIDTYDCCVIAQHCDSPQPQLVANDNGIFGCGYNSDMANEAPKAHLVAPIWNWSVYYKLAMESAMTDHTKFMETVGIYYGDLKDGLIDISTITDNCAEGTTEAIESAKALMVAGTWDVFSGQRLSFDSAWKATPVDADLMDNAGAVIVPAGGASVDDGVITGSMNYYVAGVIQE